MMGRWGPWQEENLVDRGEYSPLLLHLVCLLQWIPQQDGDEMEPEIDSMRGLSRWREGDSFEIS